MHPRKRRRRVCATREIRAVIERERRATLLLYLFPEHKLLWYVHGWFRGVTQKMYFGLVSELKRDLLKARVVDPQMHFLALETALQ
jgi:hypothetical protein